MNTNYLTDQPNVLSASTAARVRNAWPQTQVDPAPRHVELDGNPCVGFMSLGQTGADDRIAITTFPTRSGPPCSPA